MFTPRSNDTLRQLMDGLLSSMSGVVSVNLFGYPAWSCNGTIFACLYEDVAAFRLEFPVAACSLLEPGVDPFTPFGGKFVMPEWVQVSIAAFGASAAVGVAAYEYAVRRSSGANSFDKTTTCPAVS